MSDVAQIHVRPVIDPSCPKHPGVEAFFVCLENECRESLVCPECIVEDGDHNLHKVTLLKKHLDIFKKRINDFNTNTRGTVLAPLKVIGSNVADELSAFDPATTAMLEKIEARGTKIHSHIDTLITELNAKYSEIRASNRRVLEQYQRDVRAKITEIEADLSALDNCLTAHCTTDIVNAAKTGSKTYSCLEYPNGIQDVSFVASNTPVNVVAKLIGTIQIGNEQQAREESDDERIKRLEAQVAELTQKGNKDQELIQKMKEEMMRNAEKGNKDQELIQKMKEEKMRNAETINTVKDQIQADLESLAKEQQDYTRDLVKAREELEQIKAVLEQTCPKCSYRGTDFKLDLWLLLWLGWECPKCNHWFKF